jgi:hypothetical protein
LDERGRRACVVDVSSHRKTRATDLEGEAAVVSAIHGIDAAWTAGRPSGVALFHQRGDRWCCVALAPSYTQFEGLAEGRAVDWQARPPGSVPDLAALLAASRQHLDGEPVQVIAVDMPLSLDPIRGRRVADAAVSRAFGVQGCAVHSPSVERPRALADRLRTDAENLGYPLATAAIPAGQTPTLLEVDFTRRGAWVSVRREPIITAWCRASPWLDPGGAERVGSRRAGALSRRFCTLYGKQLAR